MVWFFEGAVTPCNYVNDNIREYGMILWGGSDTM